MGLKESLRRPLSWLRGRGGGAEIAEEPATAVELPLAELEAEIGYSFQSELLLENALRHRSHIHVTRDPRIQSNERLEFLGDAVLGLVVNEYLFHRFPERSEGDLTKMKSILVCGAQLSKIAAARKLGSYVRMSRSEAATGGRRRSSILADTFEAVLGAIYIDGGLIAAQKVIERTLLADCGHLLERPSQSNYKSRLQEMIQARYKSPPRYRVLTARGPDHDRVFQVGVSFKSILLGQGEGRNKKTAEQQAARAALTRLQAEPELLDNLPD